MDHSHSLLSSILYGIQQVYKNGCLKLSVKFIKTYDIYPFMCQLIKQTCRDYLGREIEIVTYFILLGSEIESDGDYGHEIKRPATL